MTDRRSVYYTSSYEVTKNWKPNTKQTAVSISADSGVSQTAKEDQINLSLASTANFVPGDHVFIYDDTETHGEILQVQDVVQNGASSYLETVTDMTKDYTATNGGEAVLMSAFIRPGSSKLMSTIELNRLINEVEDEIDHRTGHAWRAVAVTDVHEFPDQNMNSIDWVDGLPIKLAHRKVRTLDTTAGDYIYINEGTGYTNKLGTWTEALNGDYWVDYVRGILYLKKFWRWHSRSALKFVYRYGETSVPYDIRRAATNLVIAQLLELEPTMAVHPGGGDLDAPKPYERADRLRAEAYQLIRDREEIRVIHR